ncbi:short-chain fatty acyl-CoA regulator family protein [Paracoccus litorisediminis]|jgi:transcriptional regulator with XRE-family HTH domain|uniref:Helix-turn-helix domain-containing protein n=1 Tax=Paracoccus litorisediminis TaxID=2006130 RepID=A0A844HGA4_9RHOB|nr:helix-turn-helix transcriptional regulator [Paracoccus litorisediminis]MTH57858.1 helix-turn-helix domain-containing protein [Paracoccus litorisediminis]
MGRPPLGQSSDRIATGRAPTKRALIGTRIRERRLSQGWRQTEVARRAEISAAYLNLIEHNRRPVSEALLGRLAQALHIDVTELASDHEEALISGLREAAGRLSDHKHPLELDQIAEFAARYPGWASALSVAIHRADALERRLVALSDRMTRDPYLLATLHEVQSAVTSVRSTASILAETPDIEPEWRDRFHSNLDGDSARLSRTAQALVAYLDTFEDDAVPMSPQEEVEAWIAAGQPDPADSAELASDAARKLARDMAAAQARDRELLSDAELAEATALLTLPDPALLASRLGRPLDLVLRRLGVLRPGIWAHAGLIVCDGSGAPLFRVAPPGFRLPPPGEGCALWPLFEALAQPQLPVARLVEMASGARYLAWAVCERLLPMGFDGPPLSRAQMLLLPAPPEDRREALAVGPACRICPRTLCPARHEPSILGPA